MGHFSITPPPDLKPSEWAEEHIYIPVGNARPGLISFEEMTYQRGMLDAAADPEIQRITLKMGAQTGKTMTSLCLMGYYTLHRPLSQMFMQPTERDKDKWLETKFNPMVDANPAFQDCYATPRGRNGVNNNDMKTFDGGWLTFAWSGAPNTQRGISAPIIICDEVDGYKYTAEGHPVELLWQRSATFGDDRLLIEMSTPTIAGKSRIERSYLQGDCRQFFVVCPDCKHEHLLEWTEATVRWEKGKPNTALMHCPKCDRSFNDYDRIGLIQNAERDGGGWRAQQENYSGHASFHLNSLYSPLRRLSHIVDAYESANDQTSEQTFRNTILCEVWEETGERGDHEDLYQRTEVYDAEVPKGVRILTAGVDVQADRIEYEVVGWSKDEESWSIDYVVVQGDTSQGAVYKKLFSELKKTYTGVSGTKWHVYAAGIDTGYNTGKVYDAIRYAGRTPIIFALKGRSGWKVNEVERTSRAKIDRGRWRPDIISVGVDPVKRTIMQRLNIQETGPGYCHFPYDRELEYFLQLTAEQLVRKNKMGFPVDSWEKKYERNEAFDCRVYSYAVLRLLAPVLEKLDGESVKTGEGKKRKRRKVRNPFLS